MIGDIHEIAPTSWYGDLTGVSEEKGRALLAKVAEAAVRPVVNVFGPKGIGCRADAPAARLEEGAPIVVETPVATPLERRPEGEPSMKQRRPYPGICQAIWLLVLAVPLQLGLAVGAGVLGQVLGFPLGQHPGASGAINLIAFGSVLLWALGRTRAPLAEVLLLGPIRPALALPMVLSVLGLSILLSEMDNLFRTLFPAPEWLGEALRSLASGRVSLWGSIVSAVIVAPVTEELLFRGVILHGFLRRYAVRGALGASAILFALVHLNPWQFLGALCLGLVFGWWFLKTRSLLPCILGHALNNALPLIVGELLGLHIPGYTGEMRGQVEFQPPWLDLLGALLLGGGLLVLAHMWKGDRGLSQVSGSDGLPSAPGSRGGDPAGVSGGWPPEERCPGQSLPREEDVP